MLASTWRACASTPPSTIRPVAGIETDLPGEHQPVAGTHGRRVGAGRRAARSASRRVRRASLPPESVARRACRRAGNVSGRLPSARASAFQAAAATAANTASDEPATRLVRVVDDRDVDRRHVLGADDAERTDGEVVHLARRRVDGERLGAHPAQRHVRGADRVGPQHRLVERIAGRDADFDSGRARRYRDRDARARRRSRRTARARRCRATSGCVGERGAVDARPRRARPPRAPACSARPDARASMPTGGPATSTSRQSRARRARTASAIRA